MEPKVKAWPVLGTKRLAEYRIFNIRSDLKRSPRTGQEHDFYVIEASDWVNVVALTTDGKLVMIHQYRHGSETIELEIPGGLIDPKDLSPLEAGLRELREETGYEGARAELIGQIYPNPAIMNNRCHTVLVRDCEPKHPTHFDHGEDLATVLVDPREIPALVSEGKIGHSLVVVALYYFDLWERSRAQGA
jgi:8-oxo-dGTP pyrophosphatase MutT (NUDIX family)